MSLAFLAPTQKRCQRSLLDSIACVRVRGKLRGRAPRRQQLSAGLRCTVDAHCRFKLQHGPGAQRLFCFSHQREALSAELARCTVMHQRTGVLQTSPHGASSCQQKPEGLHHTSRPLARLSLVHKFPPLFSRFGVRQSFFGYACRGAKPRCLVSPNIVAKWVSRRLGWCMGPASPRLACPPAPDAAQSSGTVFLSSPPNTMITPRPDPRHFGSACPLCTRRAQLLHDVAQWRWTWSHTRSLVSTQRWVARRRPSLVSTQRVFPQRARDPLGNIDSVACSHHTDEENMALTW